MLLFEKFSNDLFLPCVSAEDSATASKETFNKCVFFIDIVMKTSTKDFQDILIFTLFGLTKWFCEIPDKIILQTQIKIALKDYLQ